MRGLRVLTIACTFALMLFASISRADERSEALDREATQIYQQVFSPFCPGRSLNDCPSSKAAELKDEMRAQLEAGKSSEEVLEDVFKRFGDQYRAVPRFSGVGILVWLVPAAFVVVGLLLALWLSGRRALSPGESGRVPPSELSLEAQRKIQEELSRLE